MGNLELSELSYNLTMLTLTALKFTAVINGLLMFFFLTVTIVEYRNAKRTRNKIRYLNRIILAILSTSFVINFFCFQPIFQKDLIAIEQRMNENVENENNLEITDEDYLFLIYALISNDGSRIGKDQAAAISNLLKDGKILVKEFKAIPNIEMDISDETVKRINLNLSSVEQAKPMLIEMSKAYQKSTEIKNKDVESNGKI